MKDGSVSSFDELIETFTSLCCSTVKVEDDVSNQKFGDFGKKLNESQAYYESFEKAFDVYNGTASEDEKKSVVDKFVSDPLGKVIGDSTKRLSTDNSSVHEEFLQESFKRYLREKDIGGDKSLLDSLTATHGYISEAKDEIHEIYKKAQKTEIGAVTKEGNLGVIGAARGAGDYMDEVEKENLDISQSKSANSPEEYIAPIINALNKGIFFDEKHVPKDRDLSAFEYIELKEEVEQVNEEYLKKNPTIPSQLEDMKKDIEFEKNNKWNDDVPSFGQAVGVAEKFIGAAVEQSKPLEAISSFMKDVNTQIDNQRQTNIPGRDFV